MGYVDCILRRSCGPVVGCFGGYWLVRLMWVINIIIDAGLRPKADVYFCCQSVVKDVVQSFKAVVGIIHT